MNGSICRQMRGYWVCDTENARLQRMHACRLALGNACQYMCMPASRHPLHALGLNALGNACSPPTRSLSVSLVCLSLPGLTHVLFRGNRILHDDGIEHRICLGEHVFRVLQHNKKEKGMSSRPHVSGFRVQVCFRVLGFGFRVSGFGVRAHCSSPRSQP